MGDLLRGVAAVGPLVYEPRMRSLDRYITLRVRGRVCSIPAWERVAGGRRGRPRIGLDQGNSKMAGERLGTGRRRHVDGVLGLELHGGEDLLEPRPVVGSDVVPSW